MSNKHIECASWEHTIETYQGNRPQKDWVLIGATAFLVGFGVVMLLALWT